MSRARACARPVVALLAAVLTLVLLAAAPAVAAPAPAPTEPAPQAAPPAAPPAPETAPPAAGPAPEVRSLRMGMRGASVRALQRELRRHGVRLRPDGVFGRVTRAAVRRVQMKLGLRATGVADGPLLERLGLVPPAPPLAPVPEAADPAAATAAAGTLAAPEAEAGAPEAEDPGRADVVEFARTLLGTPYRFAGADPSGFDCSGFVLYVFDRFGIEMPRSAHEQFAAFPEVAREDLRPGDVVFFNGLGHDGIYIGRDRFIHSSKPGDVVKISRMDVSWYASRYEGAVRPE